MSKFANFGYAVDEPRRMIILGEETGAPMRASDGREAYIDLLSMDSPAAKKLQRESINRRLGARKTTLTAEAVDAEQVDMLVALTKAWLIVGPDGSVISDTVTPEDARDLYSQPGWAWLRRQAEAFVAQVANFTRKPLPA